MMKDVRLIVRKEWRGFAKSDRWIFVIYGILVIAWGILLSNNIGILSSGAGYLWLAFFSVIISGNFSNMTFVAERMSGSLEILLTSGVSRQSILNGKILFIVIVSMGMGFLCYLFALGINVVKGENVAVLLTVTPIGEELILYVTACFMNATCGAWLSVRINNPRILPFINLFVLVIIVIIHGVVSEIYTLTPWSLIIALILTGVLFYYVAYRDFNSERVIQPVVY